MVWPKVIQLSGIHCNNLISLRCNDCILSCRCLLQLLIEYQLGYPALLGILIVSSVSLFLCLSISLYLCLSPLALLNLPSDPHTPLSLSLSLSPPPSIFPDKKFPVEAHFWLDKLFYNIDGIDRFLYVLSYFIQCILQRKPHNGITLGRIQTDSDNQLKIISKFTSM